MTTIAVCSGKGSPGATFVAVNLSAALARKNESILLVDLDLSGGDIAAYLGLDPRKGLHLLAKLAGPAPSSDKIREEIQDVAGVGVIGGLPSPAQNGTIDPVVVAENGRALADTVILDVGRIPGPSQAAIKNVDQILVVVRPDVISVLGSERCLAAGVMRALTILLLMGLLLVSRSKGITMHYANGPGRPSDRARSSRGGCPAYLLLSTW